MFKRLSSILVLVLISGSVWSTEVAVIDFQLALLQSEAGQKASQKPREEVAAMEQRLADERAALDSLSEDLKRNELTLPAEEFKKKQQSLARKEMEIRQMAAGMQRRAKAMEQELIQQLTPAAEGILKKMIEEKGLDLVLNRQLSLYAGAQVDLTAELIRRLNEAQQ